jgi:hypothetical protein
LCYRSQHSVRNTSWTLAETHDHRFVATRVHFDDFGSTADAYTVAGEPTQDAVERRSQDETVDRPYRLASPHGRTDV